jgi:hypothetical protein
MQRIPKPLTNEELLELVRRVEKQCANSVGEMVLVRREDALEACERLRTYLQTAMNEHHFRKPRPIAS